MISVVIPAFNEAATIEHCLRSLEVQTLSRTLFEVILVDNGSTDATLVVAGTFLTRLPLRIFTKPEPGVSGVRNYGAELAHGEILCFLDADCIAPADWLQQGIALQPPGALWGADYRVPPNATWVGRIWHKYQAKEKEGNVSFLPAGCLLVERSTFLSLGGFDVSVETSEDVDLCSRARAQGLRVVALPALAVLHEGTPRSLARFYRQNRWHGKHVLRVFLGSLPSTKNLGVVGLSAYTFVMVWASAIGLGLAIWKTRPSLFAVPLCLLVLPALLLTLRKVLNAGSLTDAPALWVLYQAYLFARAAALTQGVTRGRR